MMFRKAVGICIENYAKQSTWLTLILLTWNIGWAPNNTSKWQMGFTSTFRGLKNIFSYVTATDVYIWLPQGSGRLVTVFINMIFKKKSTKKLEQVPLLGHTACAT
jgi:hypothetical protein